MRAAIYTRVSSGAQVDNFSLDAQREACSRLIAYRGWTHVQTYVEEGHSAKSTMRPRFLQMLSDAEAGAFDVVVVHKLDRFSRNTIDLLLTLRRLSRQGVSLTSASEDFDFSTPMGGLVLTMMAGVAEWHLKNLAAEVAKGKREMAEQGHWSNRLPFGYTTPDGWRKDGGEGLAIPDEKARTGYELACSLAETGEYSYRQIAEALNAAGYRPTGRAGKRSLKLWSIDSVRYMLRNRFYLGQVSYRGEWFPGLHEPLITRERFDHIQRTMQARQRVPAFKARRDSRLYLLSGMIRCAACGSPMRGENRVDEYKERRTEYRYYRCSSQFRGVPCEARPYLNADEVEEKVGEYLTRLAFDENWQQRLQEIAERQQQQIGTQKPANDARRLKAELGRLKDLYRLGDMEREEYLRERGRVQAELDALPKATSARKTLKINAVLSNIGPAWQVATPLEKQALIREIVKRVEIHDDQVLVLPKPEYAPFLV